MWNNLISKFDKSMDWLPSRTIFVTRAGSHAYGTNIEGSDEDFRGVAVANKSCYIGVNHHFEQYSKNEPDLTIFELRKFLNLAADNNTNVLELLFTDPSDHIVITKFGELILDKRNQFLSKSCKEKFLGYARSQLHRILLHKRYLISPKVIKPLRSDYGLADNLSFPKEQYEAVNSQIRKVLDTWNPDFEPFSEAQKIWLQRYVGEYLTELSITKDNIWECASRKLGYSDNFIALLSKEREYEAAKREYDSYQEWKKNRNPTRAALEAKVGYDSKHAMHLIRLSLQCKEILESGTLTIKSPYKEMLLEIRNCHWSFDKIIDYSKKIETEIKLAYDKCTLPNKVNTNMVNNLSISIIENFI